MIEPERKEHRWRTGKRRLILDVAALVAVALLDVGVLNGAAYHAVAAVADLLGASRPSES